jgi:hypothetical protein
VVFSIRDGPYPGNYSLDLRGKEHAASRFEPHALDRSCRGYRAIIKTPARVFLILHEKIRLAIMIKSVQYRKTINCGG